MNARATSAVLQLLVLGLAACGGSGPDPSWLRLAHGDSRPVRSGTASLPDGVTLDTSSGSLRLATRLPADAWTRRPDGLWEALQPALEIGRPGPEEPIFTLRLSDDTPVPLATSLEEAAAGDGDRFVVDTGRVLLALEGERTPGAARLTCTAAQQALEPDGRWLVSGRRVGGEGFALWPGEALEVSCDLLPDSSLRFATAKETARLGTGVRLEKQRFRVLLDGALLFEDTLYGDYEMVRWHEVALPRGGGRGSRLRFEVDGPFAFTSILDPVVGPSDVGTYGDRPWASAKRDVVFFLADTFRADNLAVYGGEKGLAPNLDYFAESARVFRNAWSVSTHTLPTHSSFFSGLYPRQNGQVDYWNPLPGAVDTLAEYLERQGYRTVAITDGIMVSQTHGMAQGFGWFDERRVDLDATVARSLDALEADDGRPLFLFVQSYASHAPFEVRAATREELGERLLSERDLDGWLAQLTSPAEDTQLVDLEAEGAAEALAGVQTLYDAAVVDLDRGFAEFLWVLDKAKIRGVASLIVTSDHGESLGEHSRLFHAGVPFEEVLRVPLLLEGPGIEAGTVEHSVSLIDMAPTVAALAGVPPLPGWVGESLLGERPESPVFAFQCRGESRTTTLAVIEGQKKLIGFEDKDAHAVASWWRAYDLAHDPAELEDLLEADADWPDELGRDMAPRFEDLLTPRVEAERANLSADRLRELDAMGYGGGR